MLATAMKFVCFVISSVCSTDIPICFYNKNIIQAAIRRRRWFLLPVLLLLRRHTGAGGIRLLLRPVRLEGRASHQAGTGGEEEAEGGRERGEGGQEGDGHFPSGKNIMFYIYFVCWRSPYRQQNKQRFLILPLLILESI